MKKLKSYYVKPAKTFFYWGWTIPKEHYEEIKKHFGLSRTQKKSNTDIIIKFKNKKYPAKINYTRIDNSRKYKRQRMYHDGSLGAASILNLRLGAPSIPAHIFRVSVPKGKAAICNQISRVEGKTHVGQGSGLVSDPKTMGPHLCLAIPASPRPLALAL